MACCCCIGESDDSLLLLLTDHLLQNSTVESQTLTLESSTAVLSPMNSNFSSHDVLRSILELLPPPDLACAACVCRLWRDVVSDREMQENAFKRPWNVRRVVGVPSTSAFWRHPGLDRFAISHCLRRGDTVPGLALKYSVQDEAKVDRWISWLNAMMTHSHRD